MSHAREYAWSFTALTFRKKLEGLPWQWLGLCASTAGGTGSIPGWGTKIPQGER